MYRITVHVREPDVKEQGRRRGMRRGFEIDDPSFTLRGNAVLRWEYHPGSTLFLDRAVSAALVQYRMFPVAVNAQCRPVNPLPNR
jgi:hypothetical protein